MNVCWVVFFHQELTIMYIYVSNSKQHRMTNPK